jgi:chromate transport protein ChrA
MSSSIARLRSLLERGRKALLPSGDAISKVPLIDMLAHNWHLGLTSFGGPAVHFQIFRRLFVEKYHWIDETAYQEMFALCQALSGPASTKMLFAINVSVMMSSVCATDLVACVFSRFSITAS